FFSKNLGRQTSRAISQTPRIPITQDLGRYLSVPILHGKVTTTTYQNIVERIELKLSGWKGKSLSLARWVTLALSVLQSIPAYAMQTCVQPVKMAIDRMIRNFVWGTTTK
ncbi:Putative ribonuclease H protein At1g65750, partial [Linum perenne]